MPKYYAEGLCRGGVGLGDFANIRGKLVVFDTKKERNEFVERYEWFEEKVRAKAIDRDEARRLLKVSSLMSDRVAWVKEYFFGEMVTILEKKCG